MFISEIPNIAIHTLLLVYITSTCVLISTNANVDVSKQNSSSQVPAKDTEKPSPPTNITIIPGPNLAIHNIPDVNPEVSNVSKPQSAIQNLPNSVISEGGYISNINLLIKPVPSNATSIIPDLPNPPAVVSNISTPATLLEGGGKVEELPNHNNPTKLIPQNSSASITPQRTIPVSEIAESVRQKIAPRKGVNNSEYSEFKKSESITTDKPTIKKPLFTEASEDEPSSAIQSGTDSKDNLTARAELLKPKVPSLDRFNEFSNNTQQYVIPIIIVILSVPLVTIVMSFLLKRGAEWWKYRHYRRMDFLINGIYDA